MLNPKYNILAECNFRNAEEVQAIGQAFGAVTYDSKGINLSGSLQYVEIPMNFGFMTTPRFSVVIRAVSTDANGAINRGLLSVGDFTSSQGELTLANNNGTLSVRTNNGATRCTGTITVNLETEYVVTFDGTNVNLYQNGAFVSTGPTIILNVNGLMKLVIGGYFNSSFTWQGSIKYFAVIDQFLTASEVADFYARSTYSELNFANWETILNCNTRNYSLGTTNNEGTGADATLGTGTPSTFPTINERGKGLTCLSASNQFINTLQRIAIGEPFTMTFAFEGGDAQTLVAMGSTDYGNNFKGLRILTLASQFIANIFIDASNYWAMATGDYSDGGLNMFTLTYDGTRATTAFSMYDQKGVLTPSGITGTVASGEIDSTRNILLNAYWNGATPTGGLPQSNIRFFGIKKNWVATRSQVRAIHQQILNNL